MVKFHGAIDYLVLKKDYKYVFIFLDNHSSNNYCPIPAENIDSLFTHFLEQDNKTMFIFEELLDSTKFISLFNSSRHLNLYLAFYHKYSSRSNIIPVDIRILFDNTDTNTFLSSLDYLFDIISDIENKVIENIKKHIHQVIQLSQDFSKHYNHLREHYIKIKNVLLSDSSLVDIIKKDNYNGSQFININYPWIIKSELSDPNKNNIAEIWEIFFSSLLELYSISWIINSESKYNILYLGASHCVLIFNILVKFYNYRNIKGLTGYDLTSISDFDLEIFSNFQVSCIDYKSITLKLSYS